MASNSAPRLKSDWRNRYVKLKRAVKTGGGTIFDAGEIMRVYKNHGGLSLERLYRCPTCARSSIQSITGVSERDVELLPLDYVPLVDVPRRERHRPTVPLPDDVQDTIRRSLVSSESINDTHDWFKRVDKALRWLDALPQE